VRYVLMHISDIHTGPPFNLARAEQVIREANELAPDLMVVSGDFVQRADFKNQWETAVSFLHQLPEPRLTVPGNHDVPLYNPFNRLFRSMEKYKRYISPDLNPVFELPGLVVVGGNTAHGMTVDGGYLNEQQIATMEKHLNSYPADTCKVVVLHHHVVNPPSSLDRRKISNAEDAVDLFDRCGVDLMLCGHIHVSYIGTTLDVKPELKHGTIICQSGTTTSKRGKAREHGKNSYNIIEIEDQTIRIIQHLYHEEAGRFLPVADHVFPRRGITSLTGLQK
jgi:3',5'-cyclic AMP phosphodiesterase CpdA